MIDDWTVEDAEQTLKDSNIKRCLLSGRQNMSKGILESLSTCRTLFLMNFVTIFIPF